LNEPSVVAVSENGKNILAASPSAVLTQKTTISPTKSSELPKSGIVQESLILGAISVFFIALAFVL
jgi:hypothetical protein